MRSKQTQPQPDSTAARLNRSQTQPQPDSTAARLNRSQTQPQPDSTAARLNRSQTQPLTSSWHIRSISIAIIAVTLFSVQFVTNSKPAFAATVSGNQTLSSSTSSTQPGWIQRADHYVKISPHFIATLDPAAFNHLSQSDIANAQAAIAKYNAIPEAEKTPKNVANTITGSMATPALTQPNAIRPYSNLCALDFVSMYISSIQWWGTQYRVNDCLINWSNLGRVGALGVVGVLAVYTCAASGICGVIVAIIIAYIGATYFALDHDTDVCGHRGAYINVPSVGPPWPSPVC